MRTKSFSSRAALTAALLAGFAFSGDALATTFLDSEFGTPRGGITARSAALGGTGVSAFGGIEALTANPALLAGAPSGALVHFSGGLTQVNEDRFIPLFDEFDSFLNETAISLNRSTYAFGQGGLLYRLPSERPMSFAVGVFDRFALDYDYREEVRGPTFDNLVGSRSVEVDGRLRSFSVGYGAELVEGYNIGLAAHRYFGRTEENFLQAIAGTTVIGDTRLDSREIEPSGWGWSVGLQGQPHERVELGVSFDGPFTVEGDRVTSVVISSPGATDDVTQTSADVEQRYPAAVRFGATYHPRNALRTEFSLEAIHRFWEDLEVRSSGSGSSSTIDGTALGLRNTWDFRLGLEHVFYNGLPVRFGFRYLQNYADRESERSIFSAGIGYPVGGFVLDVTGQYHRQTSRQMFIFDPDPLGGDVPSSRVKVEDSVVRLVLGLTRPF